MNIIISIIYLLISFSLTILCYKKFGKIGLYIWMCLSVIICNIQTIKISEMFGLVISLGNISYGSIFLTTDILSEKYGEKDTKQAINLSFLTMIIFSLFMWIFLKYTPSSVDNSQEALETIFSYIPRITIGSMLAYYISQNIDARLYRFLKNKFNKIWISNNISTLISQIIDTLIFVTISFFGLMTNQEIIELIFTMILFKVIIAALDTPFIYIASKFKEVEEIE